MRVLRLLGVGLLVSLLLATDQERPVQYTQVPRNVLEKWLAEAAVGNKKRFIRLEDMFRKVGCLEPHLTTQKVKRSRQPNLICTLPGESDEVILVGAHYDAAGIGWGAADNWSGAVLLPVLYASLKNVPRRHTIVFVGFAAEEKGLVGSHYYVEQLSERARTRIRAMVNIDTVGLAPTKVWLSRSDEKLANMLAAVANALKLPLEAVNADRVGTSDHAPFRRLKIPCLVIHSITNKTYPILHSIRDNWKVIKLDEYYNTYLLMAAYLAYIDTNLHIETRERRVGKRRDAPSK